MEQLRAELSHLLGEKLSRIECVNEKADTALWALYDSQGNPMPLMARSFSTPGKARQLAWKTTMLARSGTVRTVAVASARSTILRKISGPHGTGNMLKCYGPRSISSITPV